MSVRQYNRKLSLIVGPGSSDGIELSNLRCTFYISRGDYQTPNSADVRIYNVKDETANRITKEFTRVVIQGGYEGNFGLLFDGMSGTRTSPASPSTRRCLRKPRRELRSRPKPRASAGTDPNRPPCLYRKPLWIRQAQSAGFQ